MRWLGGIALLWAGLALSGGPGEGSVAAGSEAPAAPVPAVHPDGSCRSCHDDPHQPEAADRACADCHDAESWAPTFTVADHRDTAFALEGRHAEVACDQCHTGARLSGLPQDCAGCHVDRHRGKLGEACADCHAVEGFTPVPDFDHDRTGFHVDGAHAELDCASCHRGAHGDAMRLVGSATCGTCHGQAHADFAGTACTDCHRTTHADFAAGRFDHRATSWPLERRHKVQGCAACHPVGQAHPPSDRCDTCHADPHGGQLGTRCEDCHRPDRWNLARFDHDLTGWALRGRHSVVPCVDCHTGERWVGRTTACWDCHAMDAAAAPAQVPAHRWVRSDCADCHGAWTWR